MCDYRYIKLIYLKLKYNYNNFNYFYLFISLNGITIQIK